MVTGNNLDAVEKPRLKIDRVIRMMRLDRVINESVTTYYGASFFLYIFGYSISVYFLVYYVFLKQHLLVIYSYTS